MEFTLPEPKNTSDEYIGDSHTNNYTKIPDKNHFIGEKVSDMSYYIPVHLNHPKKGKGKRLKTSVMVRTFITCEFF